MRPAGRGPLDSRDPHIAEWRIGCVAARMLADCAAASETNAEIGETVESEHEELQRRRVR